LPESPVLLKKRFSGCFESDSALVVKKTIQSVVEIPERRFDLLKIGRHFRLQDGTKLIVGRNRSDNEYIINNFNRAENYILHAADVKGPFAILPKESSENTLKTASSICARYSDDKQDEPTMIRIKLMDDENIVTVLPMKQEEINKLLL